MIRIGHGYDVHKIGGPGPMILGGVEVPYAQGLIAHSDGDVVLHAVSDALLGALALGDIGRHFPDTDAAYKDADSGLLLQHCYQLVKQQGYRLQNLDVTIIAQAPKMAPHIAAMCRNIAAIFEAAENQVNVKATTSEKMGFTGRKEGIAVHAVVLVSKLVEVSNA